MKDFKYSIGTNCCKAVVLIVSDKEDTASLEIGKRTIAIDLDRASIQQYTSRPKGEIVVVFSLRRKSISSISFIFIIKK